MKIIINFRKFIKKSAVTHTSIPPCDTRSPLEGRAGTQTRAAPLEGRAGTQTRVVP